MDIRHMGILPITVSPRAQQRSYNELFEALRALPENEWLSVPRAEIGGKGSQKTSTLHVAARHRGLRICTHIEDDRICIRLRPAAEGGLQ